MKKYLKMVGYIFLVLIIMSLIAITSKKFFKSYADTPTKEVTVSKVTYEFEAEDVDEKTGKAHNLRIISDTEDKKGFTGTGTSLTIPDDFTLEGRKYTVISIGDGKGSALGNTGWTTITMEKEIPTINAHAFEGCTTLKTFSFKSTSKCTTIGDYAFYGCTALAKIRDAGADFTCSAGCSPTSSTDHSTEDCSGTISSRQYKLPTSIETIGDYAFYNCDAFEHRCYYITRKHI